MNEAIENHNDLPPEEPTASSIESAMTDEQRAKVQAFLRAQAEKPKEQTESGSEQVADAGATNKGADVNWDEYDIPLALRHHYKAAMYRETPEGPKWVVMTDVFLSLTKDFGSQGKQTKKGEMLNLGDYLSEMLNNGEGWRAIAILPTLGGQAGVLLQRQVPYILPDPVPLKTDTEVEPPTDPELERAEDAAFAFMENEGLSRTLEEEAAAQQERFDQSLVTRALELNPPARNPVEFGSVPVDRNGNPPEVALARGDAQMALVGPDFGDPDTVARFVEESKQDVSDLPPTPEGWDTH